MITWQAILKFGRQVLSLLQKHQQHEDDIKRLQQAEKSNDERIQYLTAAIQRLAAELEHDRNLSARDRENLVLRLENTLLRAERGLPSGVPRPDTEIEQLRKVIDALQQEVQALRKQVEESK